MLKSGATKPYKTVEEQIEILRSRGLTIGDFDVASDFLRHVNYYRFSAYSLTVRKDDRFYPNVKFEDVCDFYYFDYDFRKIIYAYTAYIEIALRCQFAYHHAGKYGSLGYLDSSKFENSYYHASFLTRLDEEISRSDDAFVHHHVKDLGSVFPLWVAIESSSFGVLSMAFKNMLKEDKDAVVKNYYNYGRKYIENWLQCLVYVRNVAAHGGRLYNRDLRSCPVKLPKKYQGKVVPTRAFAFVYAIYNLLPVNEKREEFINTIDQTFAKHPYALEKHMGFPTDWKDYLCTTIQK
jgi:abortive infection bacteriophage resistance protein